MAQEAATLGLVTCLVAVTVVLPWLRARRKRKTTGCGCDS